MRPSTRRFAYSVFSHLSPKAHLAWQDEFARVMKPGALGLHHHPGTLVPRQLPGASRAPRDAGQRLARSLASSFVDYDAEAAAYDRGEMLYAANGGGPDLDAEFYGEAVVPRPYFEEHWGATFEMLEFIADRSRFEQAVCVMRRR